MLPSLARFSRRWFSTFSRPGDRRRRWRSRLRAAPAAAVEALEDRRLLSNIVWANRGDASDGFDAAFPGNAEMARQVVDAALQDWEDVIIDFNYANDPGTNDLTMTILMDPTLAATTLGLSTSVVLDSGATGKPISGTIRIGLLDTDGDGDSDNWFIDPTPNDHSEFLGLADGTSPNITNAFMLEATPGGPADNLNDLYSLVIHEMGHAIGFSSTAGSDFQTSGLFTDTGIPDTSSTGNGSTATLYAFEGPSVNALLTSANLGTDAGTAIHTAGEIVNGGLINDAISFNGQNFYGTRDIMNRNSVTNDKRALISNKVAVMLQDVGYSISLPEFNAHAYALLSENGHLTIRGGRDDVVINNIFVPGPSDDIVVIDRFGDLLMVSVDVGVDIPGTGAGQDPFDQSNAFITFFDIDDVSTISIDTFGGDDTIDIRGLADTMTLVINAGDDDDAITIGQGLLEDVNGIIATFGDDGNDTLRYDDSSQDSGQVHTLNGFTYTRSGVGTFLHSVENVVIDGGDGGDDYFIQDTLVANVSVNAGGGADVVTVDSLNADQSLKINTNQGADDVTINLLSSPLVKWVLGKVDVHGGSGADDTLTVNDATHLVPSDYTITASAVARQEIQPIDYDGIEQLNVFGGVSASDYDIESTSTPTTVTGGILGDTFHVGTFSLFAIDGLLTIDGGANLDGEDTVQLDDILGSNGAYVIQNDIITGNNFAGVVLENVELATLDASPLDNIIHVENAPSDTRYVVNASFGDDEVILAFGSENLITFDTPLVVNGGFGDNSLVLHDESSAGSFSYTVTEDSIDRLLFGEAGFLPNNVGVTFDDFAEVELFMNGFNSNVNVQSTNPDTKYIFHGNGGSDTLNLNRDLDEDVDPFVDVDGDDITSAAMEVEYHQFEQLNLHLGDESSTVRVHDLDTAAALNLGLGDDRVFVTPDSGELSLIDFPIVVDGQGGVDRVHLHDQNHNPDAEFTVTKNSVNRLFFGPLFGSEPGLTYFDVDFVRLFMGAGENVVDINTTAPGTEYLLDGGGGDDTYYVNLLPTAPLTLFGSVGADHAVITGTEGDDEVAISAGFGTADINMPNTETATFDGLGGTDVLVAEGVAGTDEQMEVEASTTAGAGNLRIVTTTPRGSSLFDLVFEHTEIIDLVANPGDTDTATFVGTSEIDEFFINLAAEGTLDDPVLELFSPGAAVPLLTLRDYRNFGTLSILGGDGADDFNVFVAPEGPGSGRNLLIDGGAPSGGPGGKDELNVYFEAPPAPDIDHDKDKQNHSGTFDVEYDLLHQFFIEYLNIEKAVAKSNAAS